MAEYLQSIICATTVEVYVSHDGCCILTDNVDVPRYQDNAHYSDMDMMTCRERVMAQLSKK